MKLLVVQVAALGYELWEKHARADFWKRLESQSVKTVFPALTCPVQASFRTALYPKTHGVIANGYYDRELHKTFFWEQSSELYSGKRIWADLRNGGGRVGQICWQQSIGCDSDLILSPAPIHKHHGGMIQDFYSSPSDLYNQVSRKIGRKFNLFNYWGPFTSIKCSSWITDATVNIMEDSSNDPPELLLTYLPHLDYDLQRFGPDHAKIKKVFREVELLLEKLLNAADHSEYEVLFFGDYSISPVKGVIMPNQILRDAKMFHCREVKGLLYPDLYTSEAFAMTDHQVAHIYIKDELKNISAVHTLFDNVEGISKILFREDLNHPRSGEVILIAEEGYWFAYPWWSDDSRAPDYARHVDIHSKPGFDPCELFMCFWPPMSVTLDQTKVKGTHGRMMSADDNVFWGTTFKQKNTIKDIVDGARSICEIF